MCSYTLDLHICFQIKDICYDHKLPLSDSLVNHILTLCEDSNRDGQYRYTSSKHKTQQNNKGSVSTFRVQLAMFGDCRFKYRYTIYLYQF